MSTERPSFVTDDHLGYLDKLRESGATNMFGARPYVQRRFPALTPDQAGAVLAYWMSSYGEQ